MPAEEIQPLLDRLVALCLPDDRVSALLILGSNAGGRADGFSDLDIGVITTDGGHDGFVASLTSLARAVGEPLFAEHFSDPANLHVIFADGSALELIVIAEGDLTLGGPYRVLFDRRDAVGRALLRSATDDADPDVTREEVRCLIVWFWHDVEHLVTAIGRGQAWWAYGQLDELRRVCLNLARVAAGVASEASEAYWKVDEALPASRLEPLRATVAPLDTKAILDAALELVSWYRSLAPGLATIHDIDYPSELDRLIVAQLDRLKAGHDAASADAAPRAT